MVIDYMMKSKLPLQNLSDPPNKCNNAILF